MSIIFFSFLCAFHFSGLNSQGETPHMVGKRKMPYWVLSAYDLRRKEKALTDPYQDPPPPAPERTVFGSKQVTCPLFSQWLCPEQWHVLSGELDRPIRITWNKWEGQFPTGKDEEKATSQSCSLFPVPLQLHLQPFPTCSHPRLMPFP